MKNKELMVCNTETGICESPNELSGSRVNKPVRLIYFTDPICSSCWGIEPQLRKLKQEYGDYFNIEYHMGGLLKSWDEYGGNDVNGPKSVAVHWDEASAIYHMPIDGDVWLEDPLHSSYPPSIAFKAAELQGETNAIKFLRILREKLFLQKQNITRTEVLEAAAKEAGLDADKFLDDYENKASELFEQDLAMAREWKVKGFPTIYFLDEEDNRMRVYGSRNYEQYEQVLLNMVPGAVKKQRANSYERIFDQYDTVATKEFAMLNDINEDVANVILEYLHSHGHVKKIESKNGPLWKGLLPKEN